MGCNCNKFKTEYTITFNDGSTKVLYNGQEARSLARMKGGVVSEKKVRKE